MKAPTAIPAAAAAPRSCVGAAILAAAERLLPDLERGRRIDAAVLRAAMEFAFDASDASGAWSWKDGYDACEAASVLFLRKYGRTLLRQGNSPAARLAALGRLAALLPTHTRRSEESQALQQFSTPLPLAYAALFAADVRPGDVVLEPSAGTGLMAILAASAGGALILSDALIERLAGLAPVPGALDQIVQRFGTERVAEVTGRSRRIVRRGERCMVESRAAGANLAETAAFMDDLKPILVFSDAGGTGRSYHADLSAKNRRLRVHYLLEPGWKADAAIQGLGRTNRTHQAQPPLFRPIATDVKAEKRFLSTIARRLDTLGAITRGQRQTGGQGLFRPEDNLESAYARDALRQFYQLVARGRIKGCSLEAFEEATGLKLMDETGLKDELPAITTFLNRLLALTIDLQGVLFTAFERLLDARVAGAIASGVHDVGLETLTAESFVVTDRTTIYTHPATGAQTRLLTIAQKRRNRPTPVEEAMALAEMSSGRLLVNARSGRAAVEQPAPALMRDDGEIESRVRLTRPMETLHACAAMMAESHWEEAPRDAFALAWRREVLATPPFSESVLHVVAGLLLPVWKRLPKDSTRVYRLQTDEGERIIGRKVSAVWAAGAAAGGAITLSAQDAYAGLREGRLILTLAEGLELRRARVMSANRIELVGFTEPMRERLRALGLFTEIISWTLRCFVPVDALGPSVLEKLLAIYPIEALREKEAA